MGYGGPAGNILLFSFKKYPYCFRISQTQQLAPWADTRLHLLLSVMINADNTLFVRESITVLV